MKQKLLNIAIYAGLIFCSQSAKAQKIPALPAEIKSYVQLIKYGNIDNNKPAVQYTIVSKKRIHVSVTWNLTDSVKQNDLQINILPAFKPTFNWAPQLTPTDKHIIAQTHFVGGGPSDPKEASVHIKRSNLKPNENYHFFCSFPGHFGSMNGKFVLEK